jgi:hypothetical protein
VTQMVSDLLWSLAFFVVLVAGLEVGRWLRRRGAAPGAVVENAVADASSAAVDAVVFAVLGLLIAFIFSASAARFDDRRKLINDQANALGTAWLRVDLLAEADRGPIRQRMRQWVKDSLDVLTRPPEEDPAAFQAGVNDLQRLQGETWQLAVAATERTPKPQVALLVLPPLNDWIDMTGTRLAMTHRGPPPLSIPTLVVMAVVGSVLTGFNMGRSPARSILHMLTFAGVIAFCVYVIVDLNHHRSGLIRVDAADESMIQLYASMKIDGRPTTLPK